MGSMHLSGLPSHAHLASFLQDCPRSLHEPLNLVAGHINNSSTRDDGAQMYTGIDARTLSKKTSNKGSPSSSRSHSRRGSNE